jgi:carbon storage regulator CsrA
VIGGKIRVVVLAVKGEKIRLGIEAPPTVRVDRHEVHAARFSLSEELDGDLFGESLLGQPEICGRCGK